MSDLPNLRSFGYVLLDRLSAHPDGGRATYRARRVDATSEGERVVIKQFRFLDREASWEARAELEREAQVLRELDHPRIPAYLDSFETDHGFCLVQSYLDLPPISARMTFGAREVERIADSVLELLDYLQRRLPPVIHRDLKPSNILIDASGEAYLVDFGLARAGNGRASTIAIGTPGFMAPEQVLGRPLTPQTDLFGLGATLIAMITGTDSARVSELMDTSLRFDLTRLPSGIDPAFVDWLRRLVEPEPSHRFVDAAAARQALRGLKIRPAAAALATVSTRRPVAVPSRGLATSPDWSASPSPTSSHLVAMQRSLFPSDSPESVAWALATTVAVTGVVLGSLMLAVT